MKPKPLSRTSRLIVPLGIRVSSALTAPRPGLSIFIPPPDTRNLPMIRGRVDYLICGETRNLAPVYNSSPKERHYEPLARSGDSSNGVGSKRTCCAAISQPTVRSSQSTVHSHQ